MNLDALQTLVQAAPPGQPSAMPQLLMMGIIVAIFYLLVFAPMRRKQKKHGEMISALKHGDRVITNGGIYGIIVGVGEHSLHLRIADQVKIEVSKNAIAGLQNAEE